MEDKLTIALDMDGVLADTIQKVLDMYNDEYGLQVTREDIKEWDLSSIQKEGTDIFKYFEFPGFFTSLNVMEGAKKAVWELMDEGHDVVIASAAPPSGMKDKVIWMATHFPVVPQENIIMASRKDLVQADVLIDDGIHNLEQSPSDYPVLFKQDNPWTWNEDRFLSVNHWDEVIPLIKDIEKIKGGK